MDLPKKTKETIEKIVDFVETLPEQYRGTAFGILMRNALGSGVTVSKMGPSLSRTSGLVIELSKDILQFLNKFKISGEQLDMMFMEKDDELIPIYDYPSEKEHKYQMYADYGCLLALENALKIRLNELGIYDSRHFVRNLRKSKHYFTNLKDREIHLTPAGKKRLTELINHITEITNE